KAAGRRSQNTLASRCIKIVIKHHEYVHIIRNPRLGDKRTKYHKACQVSGCSSEAANPSDALKQNLTLTTHGAERSRQFIQRGDVHSNWKVTCGVQRRKWNCPSPSATNAGDHPERRDDVV